MAVGNKHLGYSTIVQNSVDHLGCLYAFRHHLVSRLPIQLPDLFKIIMVDSAML